MMGSVLWQAVAWGAFGPMPSQKALKAPDLPVASEVYSIDGVLMGKYFLQERTPIPFEALPAPLIDALIATEDARFFEHGGIDLPSLFRVFFKSLLLQDESAGGGSTLSQQLAKNLYPRREYAAFSLPINKLRELIIARDLERVYSKPELIELYFNTMFFGENAYGIEVAAQRYFRHPARELSVEEAALLVGMLKAPSNYNPRQRPEAARSRRNLVLKQMWRYGYLEAGAADSLSALPLAIDYCRQTHHSGLAPYLRERLRGELDAWCTAQRGPDGQPLNLYTDGLKIHLSLHSRLQAAAEAQMQVHLSRLQASFDQHWPASRRPRAARELLPAWIEQSPHYRRWQAAGWSEAAIDSAFRQPKSMRIFSWEGPQQVEVSPLDSLLHRKFLLHAGILALDPANGHVRAWVGGIDHHFFQYDHVNSRRQTGSVFKPLVFGAALEAGISPCEYIPNQQAEFEGYQDWEPRNADALYGGEYSMQGALIHSVNVASIRMLLKVGIPQVIELAQRLGIGGELPPYPSLALGTGSVSLREIVAAYASFANGGEAVRPQYLLRIEDRAGKILLAQAGPKVPEQVLSERSARLIVEMLRSVVDQGTGRALRTRFGLPYDLAGKTGTTQSQSDGWFVAISPGMVIGAWVGADDPSVHFRSLALGQGARTALPLVGGTLQAMYQDPDFQHLQEEKFAPLPPTWRADLDCETYNFPLGRDAFKLWWETQEGDSLDAASERP